MFHCGYFCRLIQSNLKDEWKNNKKREKTKEQQAPSKKKMSPWVPLCTVKSTEKSYTGIVHHQTIHENINLHCTIAIIVSHSR